MIRQAFRSWRFARWTLVLLCLTLVVGIGVAGSVLTTGAGIYLQQRPAVSDPSTLVWVNVVDQRSPGRLESLSLSEFRHLEGLGDPIVGATAYSWLSADLQYGETTISTAGSAVIGPYFRVLGASAHLGRSLPEDRPFRDHVDENVVVLGHAIWSRLGRPADILGKVVRIDGVSTIVVGVAAPSFSGPDLNAPSEFWVNLPTGRLVDRSLPLEEQPPFRRFHFLARVRSPDDRDALGMLTTIAVREAASSRGRRPEYLSTRVSSAARGLNPAIESSMRARLAGPTVLAIALLVVVAINVATLLLSHTISRRRDFAIRMAVGARRSQVVRVVARDIFAITIVCVPLGLLLTLGGIRAAPVLLDMTFSSSAIEVPAFMTGLFVLVTAIILSVLVGLAPAILASSESLSATIQDESSEASMRSHGARWRQWLIAVQGAVCTVVLCGAFIAYAEARRIDVGAFGTKDPSLVGVVELRVRTQSRAAMNSWSSIARLMERFRADFGVPSAVISGTPVEPLALRAPVFRRSPTSTWSGGELFRVAVISPGYFETSGYDMVDGREFTEEDDNSAPRAAILNRAAFQGLGGSRVTESELAMFDSTRGVLVRVVGVSPDIGVSGTRLASVPTIYIPLAQQTDLPAHISIVTPIDRIDRAAARIALAVREELGDAVSLERVEPLSRTLLDALRPTLAQRLLVVLTVALALFLLGVGVFGVIQAGCQRRRNEIGVRIALGCGRLRAASHVAYGSMRLVLLGVLVGGALSVLGPKLSTDLLGSATVSSLDAYVLAATTIFGTAALAMIVPLASLVRREPSVLLRGR